MLPRKRFTLTILKFALMEGKKKKAEHAALSATNLAMNEFRKKKAAWEKQKEAAEEKGEEIPEEPTEPTPVEADFVPDEEPDWESKLAVDAAGVKELKFRPRYTGGGPMSDGKIPPDMSADMSGKLFDSFTLPAEGPKLVVDERWLPQDTEMPEPKGEGFGSVEFAWGSRADSEAYLTTFKKQRKLNDLVPSLRMGAYTKEWITDKWTKEKEWITDKWTAYLTQKKARAAKKIAAAAKAEKAATEEPKEEAKEEPKEEVKEEAEGEVKEEDKAKEEVKEVDDDAPEVDVKSVEDIFSIDGKKTPVFKDFTANDFLLVQMRVEMHHLVKAFASDVTAKDPDRLGILPHYVKNYYQMYFNKPLTPGYYGQASVEGLIEYCEDTVVTDADGVLSCKFEGDLPIAEIVKATEEARRDRENRVAAGDESAKLVFTAPAHAAPQQHARGKGLPPISAVPGVGRPLPAMRPVPTMRPGVPGARPGGYAPYANFQGGARPAFQAPTPGAVAAAGQKRAFPGGPQYGAAAGAGGAKRPAYPYGAGGGAGRGRAGRTTAARRPRPAIGCRCSIPPPPELC